MTPKKNAPLAQHIAERLGLSGKSSSFYSLRLSLSEIQRRGFNGKPKAYRSVLRLSRS